MIRALKLAKSMLRGSRRKTPKVRRPADVTDADWAVYNAVQPFTMTSMQRILALISATRYLVRAGIEGAFVECGVWRGGSMLAVGLVLEQEGDLSRDLYLFDTFDGMTDPTEADVDMGGTSAAEMLRERSKTEEDTLWAFSPLESVKETLARSSYPAEKIRYIVGDVLATIPQNAPATIAMLRLDTDWYKSTLHELKHLYPRLTTGGVLIIDDYGHWAGARKAVDEYLAATNTELLLNRLDYTGRLAIKTTAPA